MAKLLNDEKDKLSGIVDIYPAINPLDIDSITRGFPMFDLDMNRIFPGYDLGETTQRIADGLFKSIRDFVCGIQLANLGLSGFFQRQFFHHQS